MDTVLRKYTWGLDLAGQMGSAGVSPADPSRDRQGAGFAGDAGLGGPALQGLAGGIGGLLAMQAPGAGPAGGDLNAVYTYDANGNVGQLIAWATGFGGAQGDEWHLDRLVAHYEYDPYGGVTAQSGYYAAANPVRFSTKYWDDETGLGYWGYRYYSPALGRWISRDPIGELGGANVYAYVGNNPISSVDHLGQKACPNWPGQGQASPPAQSQPTAPVSPGEICGPVPNANPTDADCCNVARPTCAHGDGGGVICCNGRKVSCSFLTPDPMFPGDHVIDQCMIAHEDDHHDDVSCAGCPTGQICRPGLSAGKNRSDEECSARVKEIDCLMTQMRITCFMLPNAGDRALCSRRVMARIENECFTMKHDLHCKKLPSGCIPY